MDKNTRIHVVYTLLIVFLLSVTYATTSAKNRKKYNKKAGKKITAARYSGKRISLYELNLLYYAQHMHLLNIDKNQIDTYAKDPDKIKQLPTLNKRVFLDELIKQRLVYFKAEQDGFLRNEQLQAIISIAKEGAVVQTYIKHKFKKHLTVPNKEVEKEYMQGKDNRYSGVPIDEAEKYIKQKLLMRKLQEKTSRLVEDLKSKAKIIVYEKVLK